MGKVTGFKEFERIEELRLPVAKRVKHFQEFVVALEDVQAQTQGARCMDCGVPFCNNGCPLHNVVPDFNDLVYRGDWQAASEVLHATNNFPEFTGRVCPALCEAACTLNIEDVPVGIKSIEHAIVDKAWAQGWIVPRPAQEKTGKCVAVVGSGPAGLAAAQQLARAGHEVTVFEKNERAGGLLRYGIPDFKLDKAHIDQRLKQLEAEGVTVRTGVLVGAWPKDSKVNNLSQAKVSAKELLDQFDAVLLACGSEVSRDLNVPGRELEGVYLAMEFLSEQNRVNAGDKLKRAISAKGKRVVVIGGGDTGSDCVGTSVRQGAKRVVQLELMPRPPEKEDKLLTWPNWPYKLRTSTSHEEGCVREFSVSTKGFVGKGGKVSGLETVRVEMKNGRFEEVPGSEEVLEADLVLLAMGFVHPVPAVLEAFGVGMDKRGNAKAATDEVYGYKTNVDKVFAAGDVRRGQSLVVWAIREGRQAARAVDVFLMGRSELPY